MAFAPFVAAGACTGRAQPGTVALSAGILEVYKAGFNLGIYNCRTVAGKQTRSTHGEGRAFDIGFRLVDGRANPEGDRLVKWLVANSGKLGIQAIIWNRRIWSRVNPTGAQYRGVHPHTDHVHVELSWASARALNLTTVRALLGSARVVPTPVATRPSATKLVDAARAGRDGRWIHTNDVKLLQGRLKKLGFHPGVIDGKYGSAVRSSVTRAQLHYRLGADGIAGTNTVRKLFP
jgi:hypothetical protein